MHRINFAHIFTATNNKHLLSVSYISDTVLSPRDNKDIFLSSSRNKQLNWKGGSSIVNNLNIIS